ncbi:MAG TPA: hypothetical protein VMS31_15875 [Pyrinomonadaceae bacterium]|nr:hypothetical protein [Pyrinomonadaceae bacterium]
MMGKQLKPGQKLTSLDPYELGELFKHPVQHTNFDHVHELVAMLHSCKSPADYSEFQGHLFKAVYQVEERRGQCSRVLKRFRGGKGPPADVPPPAVGDATSLRAWQLEAFVFERAARQLRAVGDGLAWRVFGYDRRRILALSRNDSPGMMFGKDGLPYELGRVEDIWRDKQHFALLHDLTNCLRIADVSEFTDEGVVLHEVKKNSRIETKQRRRIEEAINAVMHGGPLPGGVVDAWLVELQQPYAADLQPLNDAIQLACKHGSRGMRLGHGRALIANAPDVVASKWGHDYESGVDWLSSIKRRALKRAGIQDARRHIIGRSADTASRSPSMAPWSIYPFSAEDCAALICDEVMFETVISLDALAESLASTGLRVEVLLPEADGELVGNINILQATWGDRSITLHPHGLGPLLYELMRPDVWAVGVKEALMSAADSCEPVLVFADEAKWWAK